MPHKRAELISETRNPKPSVSPARRVAFDILLRVERQQSYASELLHSADYARLSSADHGLATELVMGVLRWRSSLDRDIAHLSSQRLEKLDLEVLTALRLGAYQLYWLERIPARAVIHESVELVKRARKRSAAPFVNAVLRKVASSKPLQNTQADDPAEKYVHPPWLVERWINEFGAETAARICRYDQRFPQTTIRLCVPAAEKELRDSGVELLRGELLASAWRVRSGDVTHTRAFKHGRIAIQDEASQLVAALVGGGSRILDCCAAPGGKTSIIAQRNPHATVVAVELHPHRARLLRKLVDATNVCVISGDARYLPLSGPFDRVLVDVPCSGTGTLACNPEIKWRLKLEDLVNLQQRQLAILRSALAQVAPGGKLVYSTCSLEREENSDVIERVLAENPGFQLLDCHQELERLRAEGELLAGEVESITDGPYLRTIPGIHSCDGFFAAILKKSR